MKDFLQKEQEYFKENESVKELARMETANHILHARESFEGKSLPELLQESNIRTALYVIERVEKEIEVMKEKELSLKPGDEVEETAEWYKLRGFKEIIDFLSSLKEEITHHE